MRGMMRRGGGGKETEGEDEKEDKKDRTEDGTHTHTNTHTLRVVSHLLRASC